MLLFWHCAAHTDLVLALHRWCQIKVCFRRPHRLFPRVLVCVGNKMHLGDVFLLLYPIFLMKKNINTTFFWCLCGSCPCWKPWRTHSCKLGVAQNIVTDIGMGSKWQLWAWTHHPWFSSILCKQVIETLLTFSPTHSVCLLMEHLTPISF